MRILLSIVCFLAITSCTNPYEDITFLEIKNARLINITETNVELVADCILYNPNAVGFDLKEADFDVFLYGEKAATILQSADAVMPGKEEFTFPISASVNPKEIYGKGRGLMDVALQVLANKKVQIKYTGTIKVAKGDYGFTVPIVDSLEMPIEINF